MNEGISLLQFFLKREQVQGPYTREQIIQYVQQNVLNSQDLIANQPEGPFHQLGNIWQDILDGVPIDHSPTSSHEPVRNDLISANENRTIAKNGRNGPNLILIGSIIGISLLAIVIIVAMLMSGDERGPRSGGTALEGHWKYEFVSGAIRQPTGEIYFQRNEDNSVRIIESLGTDKVGRPIIQASDYQITKSLLQVNPGEVKSLFPNGDLEEFGNQISFAELQSNDEGVQQTVHLVFNSSGNEARARIDVTFGKSTTPSTIYAKLKYVDDEILDVESGWNRELPGYEKVSGRITLKGKPLQGNFQINFYPDDRKGNPIASGRLSEDGSYELFGGPLGVRGAKPGKYRVSIAMMETEEQSFRITDKYPEQESNDGGSVQNPEPPLPFQRQYADPRKTSLQAVVNEGENEFNFELQ